MSSETKATIILYAIIALGMTILVVLNLFLVPFLRSIQG